MVIIGPTDPQRQGDIVMNRHAPLAALAPLVLLAACSSQPSVSATNASVAEVAEKAKQAIKLEAGEWSSKTEVLELDMPGLKDPRMAEGMKNAMKQSASQAITYCVTPEEAANPSAKMFGGKDNGECRFDNFVMAGGKMDSKMTCKPKNGGDGSMTMVMSGTYAPTKYDATVSMNITGGPMAHGGAMTMKAKTTASRVGACKPGTEKAS
jgi:Protein of unknown function (DUF3617)